MQSPDGSHRRPGNCWCQVGLLPGENTVPERRLDISQARVTRWGIDARDDRQ